MADKPKLPTKQQIKQFFDSLAKDPEGYISDFDLRRPLRQLPPSAQHILTLIKQRGSYLLPFKSLKNERMNLNDFTLFVYGLYYKMQDLAISKFQICKFLSSSPLKKSWLHFTTAAQAQNQTLHSIQLQLGYDRSHMQLTEELLQQVFENEVRFQYEEGSAQQGEKQADFLHRLSNPFILLKLKTKQQKQGTDVENLLKQLVQRFKKAFNEFDKQQLVGSSIMHRIKSIKNEVYLLIQINNPLIQGLVQFAVDFVESQSPGANFNFKSKISSRNKNLLQKEFDYSKSQGEVILQGVIDENSQKRLKLLIGAQSKQIEDAIGQLSEIFGQPIKFLYQILFLLLDNVQIRQQKANLAVALAQVFKTEAGQLPKPYDLISSVKEFKLMKKLALLLANDKESLDNPEKLLNKIVEETSGSVELIVNVRNFYLRLDCQMEAGDLLKQMLS